MKKSSRFIYIFATVSVLTLTTLLIIKPEPCRTGVINGILLCGRVIIPSLFPFTMCVLFIDKSNILKRLEPLSFLTNKLFGLSGELFSIMLLSLIGGYPIGAKLLNESVNAGKISQETARNMLNYCVNGGPAFIVAAVGSGILNSKKIGTILLLSHITATLVICSVSRFFKSSDANIQRDTVNSINPADNFVLSCSQAATTVFGICSFVILFSAINAYIIFFSEQLPFLKIVALLLEVTNSVTLTNNVYIISFFLGFGGLSVWCQVFALSPTIKKNYGIFIFSRIMHGILSMAFTFAIIRFFGIALPVFSNNKSFSFNMLHSTPSVGLSLLVMGIVFVLSLGSKKSDCKILDDMI